MFQLMAVTKALADENRVRLLAALEGRELCVCQLIELIGLAPSTVSKHLSILRGARLIEGRKEGRWIYYRLADSRAPESVAGALTWLLEATRSRLKIQADRKRLDRILETDAEAMCRHKTRGQHGRRP